MRKGRKIRKYKEAGPVKKGQKIGKRNKNKNNME